MHTHSSTHLPLRPRAASPVASPITTALFAFAVLVFRLARGESVVFEVRADDGRARRVRSRIGSNSSVGEVIEALPRDVLRAFGDASRVVLEWKEEDGDARIALTVRLPSLAVDVASSAVVGVMATIDPARDAARCFSHVASAVDARRARVRDVPLLSAEERVHLLDVASRSAPRPELLDEGVLHALFRARAAERPDAIAVEDDARRTTYAELDARSRRLAEALRAKGVGRGSRIALKIPRGIDLYVAILGVLGCGAAYVPLDEQTPDERVAWIVADCGASILLTSASLDDARTFRPADGAPDEPHADDLAYVLYTSGSTGRPKGVAVTHRNVRHLVRAEQRLFGVRPDDRVLQGFSVAFDAAVEEIWLAFAAGATLVVARRQTLLDDLAPALAELKITVFSTVPSLLATIEGDLPQVRVLIVGGEACPREIARRFARPHRPLFNTYGPTEATVIATAKRLVDDGVTLGRPLPNTWCYVLDDDGDPVPMGVAGELCLGGVGVARGYVGAAACTTATRFVPNPARDRGGAPPIVYRTGDRVRFDAHGELEFLGRVDDQIKVRGFRVELGEIESALLRCDGVLEAAAAVTDDRIVAWIVPRDGAPVDADALRAQLASTLPSYMLPSAFAVLDALPRLTSGKVDRRSLRAPEKQAFPCDAPPAARDDIEAAIGDAWRQLFGREVAPTSHFFHDLGGHSLLAAKSLSLLRRQPRMATLSIVDLYAHPTPASLAAHVRTTSVVADAPPAPTKVDVRAHRTIAVAQAFASILVFGVHAAQWLGPYVAYVLTRSMPLALALLLAAGPATLLLAVLLKWCLLGRVREGEHARASWAFFRWWLVSRVVELAPVDALVGTPLLPWFLRAMGARIGERVHLETATFGAWDLLEIGDEATVGRDATLLGSAVERNTLIFKPIRVGSRGVVGAHAHVEGGATMDDDARLDDLSLLVRGARVHRGETWSGSPARRVSLPADAAPIPRPSKLRVALLAFAYAACILCLPLFEIVAAVPAYALFAAVADRSLLVQLSIAPFAALTFVVLLSLEIALVKWGVLGRVRPGVHDVASGFALRTWIFERAFAAAQTSLGALFATLSVVPWLRLLGASIGRGAEVSTASDFTPDLLRVGDDAFIADAVSLGASRVARGRLHVRPTTIGARAFVGNSSVVAGGASIGDGSLVGCLTHAPHETPENTAWIGSPAIALPRRQASDACAESTTYRPTRALVARRLVHELVRILAPTTVLFASTCLGVRVLVALARCSSWWVGLAAFPLVGFSLGVLGAAFVVAAKWLLVGRFRAGSHPLWSSFVWRNEIVTALHENLADPLFVRPLLGTPFAAWFFRALGAKIGDRVHLATSCFTEYDLVHVGDDVALDEDCTLQTHLFEDRVMKTAPLRIDDGCSVGAGSIVLFDVHMRERSSLGPLSLAMKGETLPAASRWAGVPASHEMATK